MRLLRSSELFREEGVTVVRLKKGVRQKELFPLFKFGMVSASVRMDFHLVEDEVVCLQL